MNEFEKAIRNECFYFGALPYWDQTLDYQNLTESPVFHPIIGFGGDGAPVGERPSGGCIQNGLFKDTVINIAPQSSPAVGTTRCIKRMLNQATATYWWAPERLAECLAAPDYETFAVVLEGDLFLPNYFPKLGIHGAGHGGVGGDVRLVSLLSFLLARYMLMLCS